MHLNLFTFFLLAMIMAFGVHAAKSTGDAQKDLADTKKQPSASNYANWQRKNKSKGNISSGQWQPKKKEPQTFIAKNNAPVIEQANFRNVLEQDERSDVNRSENIIKTSESSNTDSLETLHSEKRETEKKSQLSKKKQARSKPKKQDPIIEEQEDEEKIVQGDKLKLKEQENVVGPTKAGNGVDKEGSVVASENGSTFDDTDPTNKTNEASQEIASKLDSEKIERILNFCRMHQLREMATSVLLAIFRRRWSIYQNQREHQDGLEWEDGSKCGEMLLRILEKNPAIKNGKISEKIQTGDSSKWDITIITAAIQAVSQNVKKGKKQKEEDKQIENVRKVRNDISHSATSEIAGDQFAQLWARMETALVKLGAKKGELEKIKSMDLTSDPNRAIESTNSKTEQMKMVANKAFKEGKFSEAIERYSRILEMPGQASDFQAVIYSNRSVAYLLEANTDTNRSKAIQDAKLAVQLRPLWWRGYQRLGAAYRASGKLEKALDQLNTAFALNSSENSLREELSSLRQEIGVHSRQDYFTPQWEEEIDAEETLINRLGMSKENFAKMKKMGENDPFFRDVWKGHYCRDGSNGMQQDYRKAAEYYAKAAAKGNPEGMYNLAILHKQGKGVRQDFVSALYWLKMAAKMTVTKPLNVGIAEAQHSLGLTYLEGVWVEKNYEEAAKWFKKAVENGFAASANNLGILYKNGTGVELSPEKAFKHFQMASRGGDTAAMGNLAVCYLNAEGTGSIIATDEDIETAMTWLNKAVSKGDIAAQMKLDELKSIPPDFIKFQSMQHQKPQEAGFKDSLSGEYRQYVPAVQKAAENGSTTANDVLTLWECMHAAMEAYKRSDIDELVSQLAKAIRINHQLVEIHELFKPVLKKRFESHPDDLNTIVCHVRMSTKELAYLPKFLDKCLKRFPTDLFLLEMRAVCHVNLKESKKALKLLEKALKLSPNNTHFLYVRATALSMMDDGSKLVDPKDEISAWDTFLATAPEDHPKTPAAYYRKASAYMVTDQSKFVEFYEKGIAAEKVQLSCFLPYDFPPKYQSEWCYKVIKSGSYNGQQSGGHEKKTTSSASSSRAHLSNPERKNHLTTARANFNMIEDAKYRYEPLIFSTAEKIPISPKPPSLIGLKKITLDEMTPENVYNGNVLEVWVVDWPFKMVGITMVVEDEKHQTESLSIYNWPNAEQTGPLLNTFQPHRKLSIINPYLRIARFGERIIRVEHPAYVILGELPARDSACHCCGLEAKTMKCGACKVANYCSKECQKHDWHEFQHNLVCKNLSKYDHCLE